MSKYRKCNLCKSSDSEKLFEKDGYSIVKCSSCSLIYVGENITDAELKELYGEKYYKSDDDRLFSDYMAEEPARLASAESRITKLREFFPFEGKLLDVGCAAGFFLEASKKYYDVYGVEFSEYSSSYARDRFELNVFTGSLEEATFPANEFDIITMWDVIEHVIDPKLLLTEAARILKPGGMILIATGDVDSIHARLSKRGWGLFSPPWHLYFFSRKSLSSLAEQSGLKSTHILTSGVISRAKWLNNRYVNRIVNFLRLGDVMQVVFTK